MSAPKADASADAQAALNQNQAFYDAFAGGDLDAMNGLWAHAETTLCVHPGNPPIHGRTQVMESWRQILSRPPGVACSGAEVALIRGLAFVTCIEIFGDHRLAASNVFVWESGKWRMAHHHAGAIAPPAPLPTPPGQRVH